ncbi:MAG: hypothetical protein WD602_09830 [Actinomycetota bacterium]
MGHSASSYSQRGGFSLLSILTGLVVAVAATAAFAWITWFGLDYQNHDIHSVVRGESTWASIGTAAALTIGLFVAYLWGGYTAGRMGVRAGVGNGLSVALLTVFVVGGTGLYLVTVRQLERVTLGADIGTIPLDFNLTPMGIVATVVMLVALFAAAIWGGVLGSRWHARQQDYVPAGHPRQTTDSFSDLKPATPQPK